MADETGSNGGGAAADQETRPQFAMRAQYIKDLSFENPHAPEALRHREPPKFEISVTVNGRPLGDDNHERDDFAGVLAATTTAAIGAARREVDASVDRLVAFSGWTDKLAHVLGSQNQVVGPYYERLCNYGAIAA